MRISKKIGGLLFLTSISIYSQNNRKWLYGTIIDNLNVLSNIHVINLTNKQATYTNDKGIFKILAQKNDSIQFTAIGYKTHALKINITHFGIQKNIIKLTKEIIELNEVEIKRNNLTGFINSDIKFIKHEKIINAKTLKLPNAGNRILTPAERKLHTAKGGSESLRLGLASSISLDYIINTFSGRIKKLEKLKVFEDREKEIKYLTDTYSNYISKDLKIDNSEIPQFINYCESDINYHANKAIGEFSIIAFLKLKATEFKKLNKNH